MWTTAALLDAIATPLLRTDLPVGPRDEGKVRDIYDLGDRLLLVATDRYSAFDRVLGAIPMRGQVLNQLSGWWFEQTADIVPNHLIEAPDPNISVVRKAEPLPVEVIVRGFITGVTDTSLWTLYESGVERPYGLDLPAGLRKNDRLAEPVITPTTKAPRGEHDERLTEAEIVESGLVAPELWQEVRDVALRLFARGQELADQAGLVLVDTKYEFGLIDGRLHVIDEIHTPDSSRYWTRDSWLKAVQEGGEPQGFSKEFIREWFKAQGFTGDGPIPQPPADLLVEGARRYIEVYTRLTGRDFEPAAIPADSRIQTAAERYA